MQRVTWAIRLLSPGKIRDAVELDSAHSLPMRYETKKKDKEKDNIESVSGRIVEAEGKGKRGRTRRSGSAEE